MFRTFWFIVKLGLLVTLVVWLAEQSGSMTFSWMGYDVQMHVGLFLVALVGIILLAIFIYNVIDALVSFPKSWRRYRSVQSLEKGYRAVSLGLTAVAAGDMKAAGRQAKKARQFMPEDTGLPLLLEAQAARLDGREGDAQKTFAAMLENKDTAFLGVRGLLQSTIDSEDYTQALRIARRALKTHPKQPWILRTVYDLEIKNEHWDDALVILKKLGKDKIEADHAILYLVQAIRAEENGLDVEAVSFYKKALRLNATCLPAAIRLVAFYGRNKQIGAAQSLIEKTWKQMPHPDLGVFWMDFMPDKKRNDLKARLQRAEKLIKFNPDSIDSYLIVAQEAMDQEIWEQARKTLKTALDVGPDVRVYEMMTRLETALGHYEEAENVRDTIPANALPAPCWVCPETGRTHPSWHWFCAPQKLFGTIIWSRPEAMRTTPTLLAHNDDMPASLSNGKTALTQD